MKIPSEILEKKPLLLKWIHQTLKEHNAQAKSLKELPLTKIPLYISENLLSSTQVVEVERLPIPPLTDWGLKEFQHFEHEPFIAINYLNTIFALAKETQNEATLFHELVHVIQWQILGEDAFILLYMKGLLEDMYYTNPLEVMAYELQEEFESGAPPFDLEKRVREEVQKVLKLTPID